MLQRRMTGVLLALLLLAVGLALLARVALPSSSAQVHLPDLVIEKAWSSGIMAPGNEVTYELYFINLGSATANNVRIVDALPAHTTYVSSRRPGFALIPSTGERIGTSESFALPQADGEMLPVEVTLIP